MYFALFLIILNVTRIYTMSARGVNAFRGVVNRASNWNVLSDQYSSSEDSSRDSPRNPSKGPSSITSSSYNTDPGRYHINDYIIEKWENDDDILGEGAFGVVRKGYYGGTPVAIKTMKKPMSVDLEIEVYNLSTLHHPNIVSMIAHDEARIIMPYIPGGSVQKINSIHELSIVARDCMRALTYMHLHDKCIMHGDIKPDNILVVRDSNNVIQSALLGDVGLSKVCRGSPTGGFIGTPGFMPDGPPNQLSDIHALAVSMMDAYLPHYVHTTHRRLGDRNFDNLQESVEDMPPDFIETIRLMIEGYHKSDLTTSSIMELVVYLNRMFNELEKNNR